MSSSRSWVAPVVGLVRDLFIDPRKEEEQRNFARMRMEKDARMNTMMEALAKKLEALEAKGKDEEAERVKELQKQLDEQRKKDAEAAQQLEDERKKMEEDAAMQSKAFEEKMADSDKKHTELMRSKDVAQLNREAQTLWETREALKGPLLKAYVESAKKLVAYMRMKKQAEDEQLLVETRFGEEVKDPGVVRVVLYGPTGHGKSTLANRLWGDKSEEAESGPFKTSGRVVSETSAITKVMAEETYVDLATKAPMRVSITDQPGTGDSLGRDRRFAIELVNYLRGIEFINAILIVKNGTMPRFDLAFQQMLKGLTEIMGPEIWKNIVLVHTFKPKKRTRDQSKKFREELKDQLAILIPSVDFSRMPIVEADAYDLEQCTPKLKGLVGGILSKFPPFGCADLKSPLDELLNDVMKAKTDFEYTIAPWKQQLVSDKKLAAQIEELQTKLVELKPDEDLDATKKDFPLPGIKVSFEDVLSATKRMPEADDEKAAERWMCDNCSFDCNYEKKCITCDAPSVGGSEYKEPGWECAFCSESNAEEEDVCDSCQMARI